MADKKSKSAGNRYPGTDPQSWKVLDSKGEQPLTNTKGAPQEFDGFATANTAAKRFSEATGEYAGAVRA